ncbi:hypothetical protein [Streptosporangium sp. NBC_01756]|uniref:hypothetical protein n=1 Tax=Streptosporangium sp. NBC_01756 TaxID=2975950 RepID=UPI002DD969EC|nr:hypothetical protein [Streptosporangium sp. NBC_01756]WSC88249.1 hypothetical protein OIE48_08705 [Streptosporangium sp. NBC_01756]
MPSPDPIPDSDPEPESAPDPELEEDEESKSAPEPVEPLLSQATFNEAVGAAFVGSHIDKFYLYLSEARRTFAARTLHSEVLQKMRDVYVRMDREGSNKASEVASLLREKSLVVLRGESGTGRRITAVNAIRDLRLPPEELLPDAEDLDRSLIVDGVRGRFLDLSEIEEATVSKLSNVLSDYVARLRSVSSCLVVIATADECRLLDPDDDVVVRMIGPDPASVFRSHLEQATSKSYADEWMDYPKVKKALQGATPRQATRLANMAKKKTNSTTKDLPKQVEEVLSAYNDWADDLKAAFDDSDTGDASKSEYVRALLLATAALEGSRSEAVFTAADQLVELLGLEVYPGHGLFGPGATKLLSLIGADLSKDRIFFRRSDYAIPVLDHIWSDHLYLRKHLDKWLVTLGITTGCEKASGSLLHLATSHHAPELVTNAVTNWAIKSTGRARAVEILTAAALSDEIGRNIRHKLYEWSIAATAEEIQITVAEVCGGPLGIAFPEIALTRLRHLADRRSTRVRGTVCAALAELGKRSELHKMILAEITKWIESNPDRRTTGSLAFATLANLRMDERLTLIPESLLDEELIGWLAQGWRAALRNQETAAGTAKIATVWLEAAAQAQISSHVVIEIFSKVCRSSYDIGIVAPLTRLWAHGSQEPSEISRELIHQELLAKIGKLNPHVWGESPLIVYERIKESRGTTGLD